MRSSFNPSSNSIAPSAHYQYQQQDVYYSSALFDDSLLPSPRSIHPLLHSGHLLPFSQNDSSLIVLKPSGSKHYILFLVRRNG